MNDIPGLNLIPERFRPYVVMIVIAFPYLTRTYHVIVNGGGLKSILGAVLFGTNTPKTPAAPAAQPQEPKQ